MPSYYKTARRLILVGFACLFPFFILNYAMQHICSINHFLVLYNLMITFVIAVLIGFIKRLYQENIIKNKVIENKKKAVQELTLVLDELDNKHHEFKNHISILLAMARLYESNDEYIQQAARYLRISAPKSYNPLEILKNIDRKPVACALTAKLGEAKNKGFSITVDLEKKIEIQHHIEDYELNEVISCFMDNAMEASEKGAHISVHMKQIRNRFILEVKNQHPPLNVEIIEKMFRKGFSTKHKIAVFNKGVGLYNVSEIVKKYNGDLIAKNEVVDDRNYVVLQAVLRENL